ncbi:hypothetical protein M408DRAFT_158799 [Serendipita vermifera MAFF 305830]|uniref:Uncharacterized protein n=1 Tax=Serendipita vermifera MAFF 305830 TaxID=933852 RepID=A0A0C2X6I5_SERVB|nr:hypothetical protein M408DRAFT_158799 [Serendipita vermifera MAFF 305830]
MAAAAAARLIKRAPQGPGDSSILTSGTIVVGSPTGTDLPLNPSASAGGSIVSRRNSFGLLTLTCSLISPKSNPSASIVTTTAPAVSPSAASDPNANISDQQPIPVRTLVAVCVAAFILVAGLVIFVLWFGARKKEKKLEAAQIDFGKTSGGGAGGSAEGTTAGTAEEVHLKGYPPVNNNNHTYNNNNTNGMPKGSLASEQSSYYSQSTGRGRNPYPLRRPATGDSDYHHQQQQQQPFTIPADTSFLTREVSTYTHNDPAPHSPVSPVSPVSPRQPGADPASSSSPAPRSGSAQAIVKPYAVGAHPYANSHTRGTSAASGSRTSIERTGNYTIATAIPDPEPTGFGVNASTNYHAFPTQSSSPATATFAMAGARPGYDAYGIEGSIRAPPGSAGSSTGFGTGAPGLAHSQQAGRQPVQNNLAARPSLESIRSIARKASIDRTAAEAATEFVMGGPQAVGTRSRNNSVGSSTRGRGAVAGGSMYGGAGGSTTGGPGYTASVYSSRSAKSPGGKEKLSKSEKKREMEAMDNLIAALDESAMRERKRKESLVDAAGIASSSKGAGGDESDASVRGRRKDVAITGSYPLPPPDVFRAALGSAGRGRESAVEDEVDDEEIERWRRR